MTEKVAKAAKLSKEADDALHAELDKVKEKFTRDSNYVTAFSRTFDEQIEQANAKITELQKM